jgi:phage recombination protein Bet
MSQEIVARINEEKISIFSEKDLNILKTTICKNCSDADIELFCMVCKKTGLCPFSKQIYPVIRKSNMKNPETGKWENIECMTIQTGIDGYRLIADRTGRYCPGKEPTYVYDKSGKLISATVYIKKQTLDGVWHEVAASAFYSEYVQTYKDKTTNQNVPTQFWIKMAHNQLAKCAESLGLRKAFPGNFSHVYTDDEMQQANNEAIVIQPDNIEGEVDRIGIENKQRIPTKEVFELIDTLQDCSVEFKNKINTYMKDNAIKDFSLLPRILFDRLMCTSKIEKGKFQNQSQQEIEETDETIES